MTEPLRVSAKYDALLRDYAETFSTDSGKRVLEDLENDCKGGCFVSGNLYLTLYKSALRDFVDYIKEMIEKAEKPRTTEEE